MKNRILTNIFLWGWTFLGIVAIFVYSHLFTDPYIVPKWLAVIWLALILGVYCSIRIVYGKSVNIDLPALGINMSMLGCIQAIYGFWQYLSLYSSHSASTITGTFDNPAGFASCLCFCLPFVVFLIIHNNKYIRYTGWIAGGVMIVAIFLSHSRSGIVSVVTVCVILLCGKFIHKRLWKYLLFVFMIGLLIISSYWMKKDSADGRLLIWRCGLEMVQDAPWLGHGIGSFEAKYMDYQADYFKKNGIQNRYAMLADNVKQPFNEYLGVLINFGIVGLALLLGIVGTLVYCYKQNLTQEKRIAFYILLSIGIFSLFSYPFMYPFTWMVTFLAVLMLTADYLKRIKIGTWGRNIMYTATMMCFFWGLVRLGERTQSERSWQEASVLALCHSYDESLPYYVSLKHQFKDNPYFLYNYAAVLTEAKEYETALEIALECRQYWADYDLELMIGENYQEQKDFISAEKYYKNASMMCPSRFTPLYQLFKLYKQLGENIRAYETAEMIINKPVKINSMTIRMMKREMEKEILQRKG